MLVQLTCEVVSTLEPYHERYAVVYIPSYLFPHPLDFNFMTFGKKQIHLLTFSVCCSANLHFRIYSCMCACTHVCAHACMRVSGDAETKIH